MCTQARSPSPSRRTEIASSKSFAVLGVDREGVELAEIDPPFDASAPEARAARTPRSSPSCSSRASSTLSIESAGPSAFWRRARPLRGATTASWPGRTSARPRRSSTSGTPGVKNGSPTRGGPAGRPRRRRGRSPRASRPGRNRAASSPEPAAPSRSPKRRGESMRSPRTRAPARPGRCRAAG